MIRTLTRRAVAMLCAAFLISAATHASAESVMVFGGTGKLGSEVAKALVAKGHTVTVFARPSSDKARLSGIDVNYVEGDVMNAADVERAFKSAKFDAAVDALARGSADVSFYDGSMANIAKWAAATGVKQVVLHGSVGAGDSRAIYPKNRWEAMKSTMAAKDAGEKHLISSGVTYTIIRNAVLRDLAPGAVDGAKLYEDQMKFGAVTRTGLARLTADCIGNSACANKIYHGIDEGVAIPTE